MLEEKLKLMNKLFYGAIGSGLILTSCGVVTKEKALEQRQPNIIFILADDLGYGDLSFLGQQKFATPNIDQLASEGLVFTQHYAGSTVCAPSRSSLMTGQHTGNTYVRGNREIQPEGQEPLPANTFTVARMLQQVGYATGAFGKWGLGFPGSEGDPNNQGFDEFFGFNCQRLGHHYYPWYLWHNQKKVILEGNAGTATGQYAPDVIHAEALKFMENNKDKPFFMYYPTIIPHAELFAPEKYMEKYRGKFLPEKVYEGYDEGPLYRLGPYGSQPESHAAHAALINVLDDHVGEIISKLKKLGIDRNTLVIFTSDNGTHLEGGANPDYFNSNGPFRGYKRDLYEGGIRVPFIAWWPGKIRPGNTGHISAFWDFMPTVAELIQAEKPAGIDGISYLPTILGNAPKQEKHDYLYWEFHERGLTQAIRKDNWKAIRKGMDGPIELYDLSTDIGETTDVAGTNIEIIGRMKEILSGARTESALWLVK